MIKLIEKQKRGVLGEGRNYGIGFSIITFNNKKTEATTLLPHTACKDYLNDFSFVEFEKHEIGSIYGYNHKLLNLFDNKRYFYLSVKTLDYNDGKNWDKKEEASSLLKQNIQNVVEIINEFEKKIPSKSRTSFFGESDDSLILKVPIYWLKKTYLISVYTLMIRCFFNVSEKPNNLLAFLKEHSPFIVSDVYLFKCILPFYLKLENKHDFLNYKYPEKNKNFVHNFGIKGYLDKVK